MPVGGGVEVVRNLPDALEAPIRAGDPVGTAEIRSGDRVLARIAAVVEKYPDAAAYTPGDIL